MSLEGLVVPHDTKLISVRGADIPYQLNEAIRQMKGEWVWILGDDHTFEPDLLLKLLARKLDVVIPVVPRRDAPFVPVLMHGPVGAFMARYNWTELPIEGLFQLPVGDSSGQAGALVSRTVLDIVGDPWFEGGKIIPGRLMEDMYFIQRLHELQVPIWIDCDQIMPHIANVTIKPFRHAGRWYAGYDTATGPVVWDQPDVQYYRAGTHFR